MRLCLSPPLSVMGAACTLASMLRSSDAVLMHHPEGPLPQRLPHTLFSQPTRDALVVKEDTVRSAMLILTLCGSDGLGEDSPAPSGCLGELLTSLSLSPHAAGLSPCPPLTLVQLGVGEAERGGMRGFISGMARRAAQLQQVPASYASLVLRSDEGERWAADVSKWAGQGLKAGGYRCLDIRTSGNLLKEPPIPVLGATAVLLTQGEGTALYLREIAERSLLIAQSSAYAHIIGRKGWQFLEICTDSLRRTSAACIAFTQAPS
ncbi:hypothetical protein KIPB_008337 [Kipferlia bialata]|uniref:Uncharacterized protein n=1 Tax=Kipferlia bialata TaxID=797122 RepID=A0A9K3GJS5_9EUKA|nr:hypothetical protein KIPB_008337 [Kipferlia bialata]|eukprot:g8337.t1